MNNRLSRRYFVGAAASTAYSFTFVPRRVWGANERLNVACIGVGGKGRGEVLDVSKEGCNIVALCDVDQVKAAQTFDDFSRAKKYRDFREMLDKQSDIDAVTVSTPDHTHAPASMMAMKLGKHVYCQKPLTHSVHEARVMTETAADMKVATQMGNQAHAGESIRRAVEWVRAGVIGKVHEAHVWTNRPIWPQGLPRPRETPPVPSTLDWNLWLGPAPERPYHPSYLPFKWRGWWDFGTGALGDMACHIMDMAYWALELGSPVSIDAISEGATEESPPLWSTITYQFPARSDSPPVKMVWYDGKRNGRPNLPPEEVAEGQSLRGFGSVLVGERGKMFFGRGQTNWVFQPKSLLDDFIPPEPSLTRVTNEDAEWIAACKGGPPALSNFNYAGALSETVLLGNVAIRAGTKIEWDATNMRIPNAPNAERFLRRDYRSGWE